MSILKPKYEGNIRTYFSAGVSFGTFAS